MPRFIFFTLFFFPFSQEFNFSELRGIYEQGRYVLFHIKGSDCAISDTSDHSVYFVIL